MEKQKQIQFTEVQVYGEPDSEMLRIDTFLTIDGEELRSNGSYGRKDFIESKFPIVQFIDKRMTAILNHLEIPIEQHEGLIKDVPRHWNFKFLPEWVYTNSTCPHLVALPKK